MFVFFGVINTMPPRRKVPKQLVPVGSALAVEDILVVAGIRNLSPEGIRAVSSLLSVQTIPRHVIVLLLQEGYIT